MNDLIKRIVSLMPIASQLNKVRRNFFLHIIILNLSLIGRFNFTNMARFGKYTAKTYGDNFARGFPFFSFNKAHIEIKKMKIKAIVSDASFIKKSGNKTFGLGYYWDGSNSKSSKGLEIFSVGVVDIEENQAYHLYAKQTYMHKLKAIVTIPKLVQELLENPIGKSSIAILSRTDLYVSYLLRMIKEEGLLSISKHMVHDGFSYKYRFVIPLFNAGLHIVGKARVDANLKYILDENNSSGKNKYGEKVNLKNPDLNKFEKSYDDDYVLVYSLPVYSIALKIEIKIAYVINKKTLKYVVLFSTDLEMSGEDIFIYYKSRFQIEFLFRDAKQYTGLSHSQARSEEKLDFAFNASLTTVSLAKTIYYESEENKNKPFSMRSMKTSYYNKLVLKYILRNSAFLMTSIAIKELFLKLEAFGKIIPVRNRKKSIKTRDIKKE